MAPHRTFSLTAALLLLLVAAPLQALAAPIPLVVEGTLEALVAEVGEGDYTEYRLRTATEEFRLEFRGEAPEGFLNGARVRVRGQRAGAGVLVADGGTTAGTVLATAATFSGSRKLAVVLINFSNDGSRPFSRSFANGIVFANAGSVRAKIAESSGGTATLTGTTFDWLRLPMSNASCDYRGWATAARAGLTARGIDLSSYTNFMYVFPSTGACYWRGLGYMPGNTTWVNGTPNVRTPSHELTHNFGVHHASTLRCTANGVRVALSANCTKEEYGDPFTTMGAAGLRHDTALARVQMGYLPAAATKTVDASGTYTLAKAFATSGVRIIGIPRGDGTWLYLEYRRPFGQYFDNFSTSSSAASGVTIRLAKGWSTITQSGLIDTVPSTTTFDDAPLRLGRSFRDYLSGITVTVSALGSGAATVSIKYPADTAAPSAPGSLRTTAVTDSAVSLAWSASTDNRAVAGYRVWRDGVLAGTTSATTLAWTASGLEAGTSHGFTVRAVDAAGNVSAAATLTVVTTTPPAPDVTAPSAVNATIAPGNRSWALLAWSAATDDVGVAGYRVYRDGALWATLGAGDRNLRVPTDATYAVTAVDAAGNESLPSAVLTA